MPPESVLKACILSLNNEKLETTRQSSALKSVRFLMIFFALTDIGQVMMRAKALQLESNLKSKDSPVHSRKTSQYSNDSEVAQNVSCLTHSPI